LLAVDVNASVVVVFAAVRGPSRRDGKCLDDMIGPFAVDVTAVDSSASSA